MKKVLLIHFLFFNFISAQDISIEIDLGESEFEYLEHIYAKINITNNDGGPIRIRKSWLTFGPSIRFILKNENEELFDYTGANIDVIAPEYEVYYLLDPGESREFPLRGGYYFLKDYYKDRKRFYIFLPVGRYKVKAQMKLADKLYESDYKKFRVLEAKDNKALN